MRHLRRRAFAGTWHDWPQRREGDRGRWHYVANELPATLPQGASVIDRWQANWDGGPSLLTRVAIVDEEVAGSSVTLDATMLALDAARARLDTWRPDWAGVAIETCVWIAGPLDRAAREAAAIADDALDPLIAILDELATGSLDHARRIDSAVQAWRTLAAAGAVFPTELDDPYGAFGPSGPPAIPASWRGRAIAEIPSPFDPLGELREIGIDLLAIGRDTAAVIMTPASSR